MSKSVAASSNSSVTAPGSNNGVNNNNRNNNPGRGSAGGRGGGGSKKNNGKQRKGDKHTKKLLTGSKSDFKGNTTDMNGYVFECVDESGDRTQFSKTLEVLGQYSSKKFKFPEDLRTLFKEPPRSPYITPPTEPGENATKLEQSLWDSKVAAYSKRCDTLVSNVHALYDVIWGQCSKNMQTKIKAVENYDIESENDNCAWLLNQIKGVIHQFNSEQDIFYSLHDARLAYMNCKQLQHQSNAEYYEVFRSTVDVLEFYGANIAEADDLIKDTPLKKYSDEERRAASRDRTLATAFLKDSDPLRYSKLLADLKNQYNLGQNQYPKDLTSAYRLLVHYDPGTIPSATGHNSRTSPVATLSEPESNEQVPTVTTNSGLSLFQCGVVLTQQGILSSTSPPITDLSYTVPPE